MFLLSPTAVLKLQNSFGQIKSARAPWLKFRQAVLDAFGVAAPQNRIKA